MFRPVSVGKRKRYSYARIKEVMEMPHLLDIQRNSYKWFLDVGLSEIFKDISPITDFTGNLVLTFESFSLGEPKYSLAESKERDVTYSAPLRVNVRLYNKETGEIKEQEVFMGDFPLMTDTGTFIINGAERVIVSQLVRSPGAYYGETIDTAGKRLYNATVIPNRGAWIELETDADGIISVRIDRTRKMPVTYFLRALGISSNSEISSLFGDDPRIVLTMEHDGDVSTKEAALLEIYRRLRPGEPPTIDNAQQMINSLFFDPKRYDLATVGRYKLTKKLGWKRRILGKVLAEPIIDKSTGEVLIPSGEVVTDQMLDAIDVEMERNAFGEGKIIEVYLRKEDESKVKILCSPTLDIHDRTITINDIVASISYLLGLMEGYGYTDDIDHLGNRRVRAVGELLQNQFRIGLSRMERVVRERMTIQDVDVITPQALINIRPVVAAMKEFFGSSQLSQFMDQHNPLSELTHKRRLSALGPGGLSRERAGFEVRDVHNSHYGRMCPVESPEGPNIGLIGSLANYARVNQFGFMETPYRRVDKKTQRVTDECRYLTADEEDEHVIAQANEPLDENDWFVNERVTARKNEETTLVRRENVDYMDVSPRQVFSIATAMIPFLENDDANRALMGANMQRQAVPLL
ncbi:MAG: DNA-directed RNA polymerase subunit beta, partial [Selenomonadaceae bacterium]|nr:DNA-directed RNA polymerase subunit beta [Selenomonadaceae bacterium]